jgi:hypothetical protein
LFQQLCRIELRADLQLLAQIEALEAELDQRRSVQR